MKAAGKKIKVAKPIKEKKIKVVKEKKAKVAKPIKEKKIKAVKEKKESKKSKVEAKIPTPEKPIIKTGRVYTSHSSQDPLVEIVKIKKQDNEKRTYKIKDYVIYPKHGIGQIVAVEKDVIAGIEINFYKIEITKDKLVLTIPKIGRAHV